MATAEPKLIVPNKPTDGRDLASIHDEGTAHMAQAQRYYLTAQREHQAGRPSRHLFTLAQIEQNAANLCLGMENNYLMAMLIHLMKTNGDAAGPKEEQHRDQSPN